MHLTSPPSLFQDMDGVITRFDWNALKFASSRKRDILYEYVKRAVRCLWEDVHARAALFRSARDAYGNLREPMRAELKSPARLLPMRLDVDSSLKGGSSSDSVLAPQTINQQAVATWKDHDDAVAVLAHTLPMSRAAPRSPSKHDSAIGDNEDAEDQMLEEDTNDANSQQQVPAFQDYCMLRVFVSWPPPPADCDASLQHMWYAMRSCCPGASFSNAYAGTKNPSRS